MAHIYESFDYDRTCADACHSEQDDPRAADQLLRLVNDELRKLHAARLANEKPGQTLQATVLVHEAYLRLVDQITPQHRDGRGHFFAVLAQDDEAAELSEAADFRRFLRRGHGAATWNVACHRLSPLDLRSGLAKERNERRRRVW